MGAFDHLNGPQCGAFERHFRPGRGNLNNNFQKSQMPGGGGARGGMLKLRFDRYITATDELLWSRDVINCCSCRGGEVGIKA